MSQSGRRGPAIVAASSAYLDLSDIAHRGQWSLDSFATIMEYICATSQSDQKVGRVLSGWENPHLQVSPPSLESIIASESERERIQDYVGKLFRTSMHKIFNKSFANVLTAILLMYYRDTIQVCKEHRLHSSMVQAGHEVFPCDDTETITQKLLHWGEKIRSRFVMDNLTQFRSSVILNNLSEEAISILRNTIRKS